MALATTTLIDEGSQPRQTGIVLRIVGAGPYFPVQIERSPNGSTGWVALIRQVFPSGTGGIWVDKVAQTGVGYWYRAKTVADGYQDSGYLGPVQGWPGDLVSITAINSPPLYETQARLYGALSGPSTIKPTVSQNDGANARVIVKGRQTFLARHKDVLTFAPTFQDVPKYRILGGVSYVPNTVWTTADDYRKLTGSITTGTAAFTATSGTFTAGDVGKAIRVAGAGVASADLVTTIAGFTDSTHVTLTANASTTVSAALTEVYTGTLLAPLTAEQYLDDALLGLTVSGGTVQARLKQDNSSLTPRSVSWGAGTITTPTNMDVDLGTNMPAYDAKYTVTWAVQVDTLVNSKYAPTYCETQLTVEVQSNDGGGWVTRGTYYYNGSASGLGDHQTDNWSESRQYTVAGLGNNDDWRIAVTAFTVDGNDGGSYYAVDPGSVSWQQGTNNDRYANRTPGPADYVIVEVEAA